MNLNYKEFGEGKTLIVLHGLLGSLDNWQTLAKRFAEHLRVFTVDQRNHGQSPHSEEMSYDLLSHDLGKFIEDHQIENPVLMGHSMGGKTVMKYALENPGKVQALIPVDMSPRNYNIHHEQIMEALSSIDFEVVKSRKEVEEILMRYLNERSVVQFLAKNVYWKEKDKLAYRFNLESLKKNLELITNWPDTSGQYLGDTLFIKGEDSNYITDNEPSITKYFPNSQISNIVGAGHWMHAEKPDEFYRTVMEFLNSK